MANRNTLEWPLNKGAEAATVDGANFFQFLKDGEQAMRSRPDKKNKTEIFNERMKQRKEKEQEMKRRFEEAGKPDPHLKKDDSAQQPAAPSAPKPPTPAKPKPPVAPAPKQDIPNRPGKAERERRGPNRHGGKRF